MNEFISLHTHIKIREVGRVQKRLGCPSVKGTTIISTGPMNDRREGEGGWLGEQVNGLRRAGDGEEGRGGGGGGGGGGAEEGG